MGQDETGKDEAAPPKRGQAYFDDVAAQTAKRNADARKAARERNAESEKKVVSSLRDAERRDLDAAIKAHKGR